MTAPVAATELVIELPVPVTAIDEVMTLVRRRTVTGGEIFDLQIVATMKLNGILRIYTFNIDDFEVFPELTVVNPARV